MRQRNSKRKNKKKNRKIVALSVLIVASVCLLVLIAAGGFGGQAQREISNAEVDSMTTQSGKTGEMDGSNDVTGVSQMAQADEESQEKETPQEEQKPYGAGAGILGTESEKAEIDRMDTKDDADGQKPENGREKQTEAIETDGKGEALTGPEADAQDATDAFPPVGEMQQIELTGLSTESLGWGQGVHFDEQNRPVGSLNYQDKYGKYNAYFIAEPAQVIYLTFDEGYEYGCTPEILDVLKEKGVKAVFFITLSYAKSHPELVQRMLDEGHQLGNHSVTHPSQGLPSQTVEQQREEVMGCHQYVKENFGYDMHLFRYPTGKFSEQSLAVVNNCNYKSVFWSFAYLDYDVNNQPDEGESLKKLVDRLHPGAIYLLHAESVTNTHILGSLIDQGREQGYSFEMFW